MVRLRSTSWGAGSATSTGEARTASFLPRAPELLAVACEVALHLSGTQCCLEDKDRTQRTEPCPPRFASRECADLKSSRLAKGTSAPWSAPGPGDRSSHRGGLRRGAGWMSPGSGRLEVEGPAFPAGAPPGQESWARNGADMSGAGQAQGCTAETGPHLGTWTQGQAAFPVPARKWPMASRFSPSLWACSRPEDAGASCPASSAGLISSAPGRPPPPTLRVAFCGSSAGRSLQPVGIVCTVGGGCRQHSGPWDWPRRSGREDPAWPKGPQLCCSPRSLGWQCR